MGGRVVFGSSIILLAVLAFLPPLLSLTDDDVGHVRLLAVSEGPNGTFSGSIADLYLEIDKGKGRVFIDTRPASKLDTQMSTRLANSIGCKYVGADCSSYDFFYTITSDSTIVGGPSASAAVAVLTAGMLQGISLRDDVAITGTVSPDYLIGPVGGLVQKIDAASAAGITRVLIPIGERGEELGKSLPASSTTPGPDAPPDANATSNANITSDEDSSINTTDTNKNNDADESITGQSNETTAGASADLVLYGKQKKVEVVETSTLDDAFFEFTGKRLQKKYPAFAVDKNYAGVMQFLAKKLCSRSAALQEEIMAELSPAIAANESVLQKKAVAANLTGRGIASFKKGDFYSGASYCFGANVQYRQLYYVFGGLGKPEAGKIYRGLRSDVSELNQLVNKQPIETITDLQAFMIVKERLIDANDVLDNVRDAAKNGNITNNDVTAMLSQLAYAKERLNSAIAWARFFNQSGETFDMDAAALQESCKTKLFEAEEYYQYLSLFLPNLLSDTREQLDKARGFQQISSGEMCLFKAALAKAQMNLFLSTMGVTNDQLPSLLDRKLEAVRQAISEQQSHQIFPILGYSYYEYAASLRENDIYSALLYAEYALEFSNLDMYLKKKSSASFSYQAYDLWFVFIGGVLLGVLGTALVAYLKGRWWLAGFSPVLQEMKRRRKKRRR